MSESPPTAATWDARYAEPGWAYGTEPNDFLRAMAGLLPASGRVLCLAEGQGRNAVHLATLGHTVTAVDQSAVGLSRARELAAERGVALHTQVADLADLVIAPGAWDGVVSIFAHVPAGLRRTLHAAVVAGLAPGGALVLEAYTPGQAARGTGGPGDPTRMMTLAALRAELAGLDFEVGHEIERDVVEGRLHHGTAEVVQVVARRPR